MVAFSIFVAVQDNTCLFLQWTTAFNFDCWRIKLILIFLMLRLRVDFNCVFIVILELRNAHYLALTFYLWEARWVFVKVWCLLLDQNECVLILITGYNHQILIIILLLLRGNLISVQGLLHVFQRSLHQRWSFQGTHRLVCGVVIMVLFFAQSTSRQWTVILQILLHSWL